MDADRLPASTPSAAAYGYFSVSDGIDADLPTEVHKFLGLRSPQEDSLVHS